jgi:hypothetical protein
MAKPTQTHKYMADLQDTNPKDFDQLVDQAKRLEQPSPPRKSSRKKKEPND